MDLQNLKDQSRTFDADEPHVVEELKPDQLHILGACTLIGLATTWQRAEPKQIAFKIMMR
jgi:hypothetical protein